MEPAEERGGVAWLHVCCLAGTAPAVDHPQLGAELARVGVAAVCLVAAVTRSLGASAGRCRRQHRRDDGVPDRVHVRSPSFQSMARPEVESDPDAPKHPGATIRTSSKRVAWTRMIRR
jgi:hypothetical protein